MAAKAMVFIPEYPKIEVNIPAPAGRRAYGSSRESDLYHGPTIIGIMWARGVADGGQPNTYGAGPINSAAVAVR